MAPDHTPFMTLKHTVYSPFFLDTIWRKLEQTTPFSTLFWIFVILSASLFITAFLIFLIRIVPDKTAKETTNGYDVELVKEYHQYAAHRYTEAQRAILQFQRKKQEPQLISYIHPYDEDGCFDCYNPDLPSIVITPSVRYRLPSRRKYSNASKIHASSSIKKHESSKLDTNWASDNEVCHLGLLKTSSISKPDIDVRGLKLKKSFTGTESLEQPSILYPRTNSSGVKDTDISYEHAVALPFRF